MFDIEQFETKVMRGTTLLPVTELMRNRRSVRHYLDRGIPVEMLDALLTAALEAPSSWNYPARSIVAVTDPDLKARLAEATGGQPQPQEAPVLHVFVAEENAWPEDAATPG